MCLLERPEARGWKLEARSLRLEARGRRPEAGGQKLEAGSGRRKRKGFNDLSLFKLFIRLIFSSYVIN